MRMHEQLREMAMAGGPRPTLAEVEANPSLLNWQDVPVIEQGIQSEKQPLSEEDRLALAERAKRSWAGLAEVLGLVLARHHVEWLQALKLYTNLCILAAACHGKTTIFGQLVPIGLMLRNPNIRIGYVSANEPIASSILRGIVQIIESEEFIELFGAMKPAKPVKWTTTEIQIERTKVLKDPTFFAGGITSAIINRRFDVIIFDDICSDENMATAESREKIRKKVNQVILPCLEPWGVAIFIGSRQHYDDYYSGMMDSKLWKVIVQQAHDGLPDGPIGNPLWPEYWTRDALERKREEVNSGGTDYFSIRFMNCINAPGTTNFPMEWVQGCLNQAFICYDSRGELPDCFDHPIIAQAMDPAASQGPKGKCFAYMTTAIEQVNGRPKITILNAHRSQMPYPLQKKFMLEKAGAWLPSVILVETNGVQRMIIQDMQGHGLPLQPTYTGREKADVSQGIPYMATMIKNGEIIIPWGDAPTKRTMGQLVDELTQYPKGKYSDMMMTLWFIVKHFKLNGQQKPAQTNHNHVCPHRRVPLSRIAYRRVRMDETRRRFDLN